MRDELPPEDTPIDDWRGQQSNELRALLCILAYPVYVMGSGEQLMDNTYVGNLTGVIFLALEKDGILGREIARRICDSAQ